MILFDSWVAQSEGFEKQKFKYLNWLVNSPTNIFIDSCQCQVHLKINKGEGEKKWTSSFKLEKYVDVIVTLCTEVVLHNCIPRIYYFRRIGLWLLWKSIHEE